MAVEIFSMLVNPEHSSSAPAYSYYAADLSSTLVIAHWGGNGLWPGNTLYAFKEAVRLGADTIETDIHLSKDGVLMLMHDQHLSYTTEDSGLLENKTLAELKNWTQASGGPPTMGKVSLSAERVFPSLP